MSTNKQNNGTPPKGHEWGERTVQSVSHTAPGYWESDAYEIRQCFGIPQFDPTAFEPEPGAVKSMVYPDVFFHEQDPEVTKSPKGTDCFILGERGSGKTTFALSGACRVMENNPETDENNAHKVVWRGSPQRSGWLPFKHWTTVWLPANAEIDLTWKDEDDDVLSEDPDLEEIVREVRYYDDVKDLLDGLADSKQGTFNVVYPDPSFSGCEELMRETDRVAGDLPFVSEHEARGDDDLVATPLTDWWFAFQLGRVEYGTHVGWMALFFDETADYIPQSANNHDGRRLWDKIELLRSIWAESRRAKFSLYFFGHYEVDVHEKIRRQFKWRISMPDETPNPIENVRSTHPVGFKTVPMTQDLISWFDVGTGLLYNQSRFSWFSWGDVPDWSEDDRRWLQIRPVSDADAYREQEEQDETSLEYEERIFGEWQNASNHRLYVKEPGSGYISVDAARVGEDLESPLDGLEFQEGLVEQGDYREVRMSRDDGGEIVVARIPTSSKPLGTGLDQGGASA
jgi:hypothetical protein